MIQAEKYSNNLTLQFGVLAANCTDDNDYLKKANQLIDKWKKNPGNSIDYIFFDTKKPDIASFENILSKIQKGIEKVLSIPVEKRKFDF